jgi:phenylpropionate dioxygenase-like ring-hydroxylating dioxygenase large terminal subunit
MTITNLPPSLIPTLSGEYYTDPEVFAQEQERVFEAMWFCVARAADLDKPGAFRTYQVGRESVLISRSRDGSVKGFLNICRHRGAKLCTEESGEVKRAFQCPYHAWTYGLDGKLVAAPNLTSMPDIDRKEYGLINVHVREWLGYVWVCLADEPPSFEADVQGSIVERLGDLESIERYGIDDLKPGRRITYDVKANWKLIIENFMECYHCATIHPELTEVLPEFADGCRRRPGPPLLRDHRQAPGVRQPRAGPRDLPPDVPDGTRPHGRRVRLAVPAARRGERQGRGPFGGTVPPSQPAGLRRLRADPAGDELQGVRQGRRPGAQRAPHRRVPHLAPEQAGGAARTQVANDATWCIIRN